MQNTLSLVDLTAITCNALAVRRMIGGKYFFAVVKANAYGHGAERIAAELEDVVDGFCVAIVAEGARLRVAGIKKPILVLAPPTDCGDAESMRYYNLIATVADLKSAQLSKNCRCHLAVNTGMNRYGCFGKDLNAVLKILPPRNIEGVYSHLFAAESAYESALQLKRFSQAASEVKAVNPSAIAHLAASGGILRGGEFLFDGVRCGLLIYGYAPAGFRFPGVRPALKVYARLAQRVSFCGRGIGYNLADKDYEELYTYRLGYADGFFRGVPLGEKTLCMDSFISCKNSGLLPVMTNADEYAKRCGTIAYEVLCSVTKRSSIQYVRTK